MELCHQGVESVLKVTFFQNLEKCQLEAETLQTSIFAREFCTQKLSYNFFVTALETPEIIVVVNDHQYCHFNLLLKRKGKNI